MNLTIPPDAEYLSVEFALPAGGTHRQRVAIWGLHGSRRLADVIAKAVAGAKRNRVSVSNCLRITHGKVVLFDAVADGAEAVR